MRKLTSIAYSEWAFNLALFLLRVGSGALIVSHGYDKLVNFAKYKTQFISFMGLSASTSLSLSIFAEFFCGIFLILGLFSRLAAVPLIINMATALVLAHNGDAFGVGEKAVLFLLCFLTILFCGPGKASVDGMIN